MKTTRNTRIGSLERIWIHRHFHKYVFQDDRTKNTIGQIKKFLEEVEVIAKVEGYAYEDVNIFIESTSPEYEEDRGYDIIVAQGFRLETDIEYKTRLKNNLDLLRENKKSFDTRSKYYTQPIETYESAYEKRATELETTMNSIPGEIPPNYISAFRNRMATLADAMGDIVLQRYEETASEDPS